MALPTQEDLLNLEYPADGEPQFAYVANRVTDIYNLEYPADGEPLITNPLVLIQRTSLLYSFYG